MNYLNKTLNLHKRNENYLSQKYYGAIKNYLK